MTGTVKDIMTTRVVYAREGATFKDLAVRMRELRISGLPVVDEAGQVIGVVSETDLLNNPALNGDSGPAAMVSGILRHKDYEKAAAITAGDLMTSPAVTVSPDDTIEHAARLMYSRRLKRLPVTGEDGRLAGIVTRTDLLSVYARPDAEIRQEITGAIATGSGMDPRRLKVTVKDGIVTLNGEPETTAAGLELVRRARHTLGVIGVRDRLSYPEPDLVGAPGYHGSR